jgi:hypothetical protein
MKHLIIFIFLACFRNMLVAQKPANPPANTNEKITRLNDSAKTIQTPGDFNMPEVLYDKGDGTFGLKKADESQAAIFRSRHNIPSHAANNKMNGAVKPASKEIPNKPFKAQPELLKN